MTLPSFSDPDTVARYADGPIRMVPGFLALQAMADILLVEHVGDVGHVLVLGAGGGLELKVFADHHPGWQFLGVDPSAQMLALARATLGPLAARVELVEGYIDTAPDVQFDAATCLLTLHFLDPAERLQTLVALRQRLKPGAPLVVAHHSFPNVGDDKLRWLHRFAAFATASGVDGMTADNAVAGIGARLPVLSPAEDEALLREAGFGRVELFYAALSFKGWVAYA